MDESQGLSSQSDESFQHRRQQIEPIYNAFICRFTKQIMRDPVTLENGQTFERESIENWFNGCKENNKKLVCPLTYKELKTIAMIPNIALRNTIEEWKARNEAVQLDMTRKLLNVGCPETDILQALEFLQHLCQKNISNKHIISNVDLIPMIVDMLRSSNCRVRCRALETLRIVVEDDEDNKEIMVGGDNVNTIVKLLSDEQPKVREEAISLLFELSKSEAMCEKIGSVNGAILILIGMTSCKSENVSTVEKADKILGNLENNENNARQMAENGRLQPLLTLLIEGSPEIKVSMASYLAELALSDDVKIFVARTVGSSLIDLLKSDNMQSRVAALIALNQISSCESSAKILVDQGILSPLIKGLFSGSKQLPMQFKEISATILANIASSDCDFDSIPVGPNHQTLVSEDILHNYLHLINNTGPAMECKLLHVLVGLTSSPVTKAGVVSAIKSSGAINSLVTFIEAPQQDLRITSIKLLQNLSPNMGQELATSLRMMPGLLSSLIKVVVENITCMEEQAAAVGLLADLLERDIGLTRQILEEGVFEMVISRIRMVHQEDPRGNRFVAPYLEGLVRVLSMLTFMLPDELKVVSLCRDHDLVGLFVDLLQVNGLDNVQLVSAFGLLADLLERDIGFTRQVLEEGAFEMVITRIRKVHQEDPRGSRFVTPYLEGLTRVLSRLTFMLPDEPKAVSLCREHDLAGLFVDLLQVNEIHNVQMVSAFALENLSRQSKILSKLPETPIFHYFSKQTVLSTALCRVHLGVCSQRDTFCLLQGSALPRLVALLDHTNEKVTEASLAALSTLLDDGVNIEGGVAVLREVEGIKPIMDVLLEKQTDNLWRRAVWVVERLLRIEDIAYEVSGDLNVSTALVHAFQHGDYQTRQTAERALKHVDKIPNFSNLFLHLLNTPNLQGYR
ncbi:U-box domain-containing protein 43 [Lactuca sativa]|uniref:U-box domain-containing protein 43 n=1 Tax=Lactuca sativa TaxID=4236 RepID=UPI000CC46821|nr:U-box domain-containing protein 43 [Lactuca sativa]XP_023741243.1 U-box domain-containing protein 43 [Lactuca sativa]XP_023741244.1 U-box domain-containing protein 43 [Lactuca sativa]XP_023741245.1 U-box domain-containing protein 43 [Lactuca sativa]